MVRESGLLKYRDIVVFEKFVYFAMSANVTFFLFIFVTSGPGVAACGVYGSCSVSFALDSTSHYISITGIHEKFNEKITGYVTSNILEYVLRYVMDSRTKTFFI